MVSKVGLYMLGSSFQSQLICLQLLLFPLKVLQILKIKASSDILLHVLRQPCKRFTGEALQSPRRYEHLRKLPIANHIDSTSVLRWILLAIEIAF